MKRILRLLLFFNIVLSDIALAAPPAIINHQGRIAVNGINFDGTGHFKFALVNGFNSSLWSNDGTSSNGSEPTSTVLVEVNKGHYAIGLGDTSVSGMDAFPENLFAEHNDLKLRIWFSQSGTGGSFEHLLSDRKLTSVPYALSAPIPNGSIGIAQLKTDDAPAGKILSSTPNGIEWIDNPITQSTFGNLNGIGLAEPDANLHLGAMTTSGFYGEHDWADETIICLTRTQLLGGSTYIITRDNVGQHTFHVMRSFSGIFPVDGSLTDPDLNDATKIVFKDNLAFVISETLAKLTIIDLSNVATPRKIGVISDPRLAGISGVEANGLVTTLYASAKTSNSIVTIDISDPSTPQIVHHLTHPDLSSPTSIWRDQNHLYIGGIGKFFVVDRSIDQTPIFLTTYSDPVNIGTVETLTILRRPFLPEENLLVIDSGTTQLLIVNVAIPAVPVHGATYLLPAETLDLTSSPVSIRDRYLLAVALVNGTHAMIDFPTPDTGYIAGSVSVARWVQEPFTHAVVERQNALFFTNSQITSTSMTKTDGLLVEGESTFREVANFIQTASFHSNVKVSAGLADESSSLGNPGQVLTSTGAGVDWVSPGLSLTGSTLEIQGGESVDLSSGFLTNNGTNTYTGPTMTFGEASTVQLWGTVQIGGNSSTDDDSIYFDSANSEALTWDDSLDQFIFSDDLAISGKIRVGGSGGVSNTPYNYFASSPPSPSSGDITNSGDVYIDRDLEVQQTIYVGGSLQQLSDRNAKEQFAPVDPKDILEKVAALPITTWQYKARGISEDGDHNEATVRHIGPVAQDFYAAFEIGLNERTIATVDADGIALVAIQALKAENDDLKKQYAAILERLKELEESNR